jgi:hypothetical protein
LDNAGDPFCDTNKIGKLRYERLLVAEVDGRYAGFLYWHIGNKPFFAHELRALPTSEKFRF